MLERRFQLDRMTSVCRCGKYYRGAGQMVFKGQGDRLGVGRNKTVGILKQRTGQQTGGVERSKVWGVAVDTI